MVNSRDRHCIIKKNCNKKLEKDSCTIVSEQRNNSEKPDKCIDNCKTSKILERLAKLDSHSGIPSNNTKKSDRSQRYLKNNIKAGLWPFPNDINVGGKYTDSLIPFHYDSSFTNSTHFNQYKKHLRCDLKNPLQDLDIYLSNLQDSQENYQHLPKLTLKELTIKSHHMNISDLNKHNFHTLESYTLDIDQNLNISINAETYIGVGYALISLQQLVTYQEGLLYLEQLPIHINDRPKTYYRGNFLDVARTYFPVESILEFIQLCGYLKLNHIDLHLNDNQSFPMNVGPITKLLSINNCNDYANITGAFSKDLYYDLEDVHTIINTAKNYGITIIPGIDSPGHCAAFLFGSENVLKTIIKNSNDVDMDSFKNVFKYWQALYQAGNASAEAGETGTYPPPPTNAPEPIIAYLNITGIEIELYYVIIFIAKIMEEIFEAFKVGKPGYGYRVDLNLDEVKSSDPSSTDNTTKVGYVYTKKQFGNYINKILELFSTENKHKIEDYNKYLKKQHHLKNINDWSKFRVHLWIDPLYDLNTKLIEGSFKWLGDKGLEEETDGFLNLENYLEGRITFCLWITWPDKNPLQTNCILNNLNAEFIMMDSNTYYLDSGHPSCALNGITGNIYYPSNGYGIGINDNGELKKKNTKDKNSEKQYPFNSLLYFNNLYWQNSNAKFKSFGGVNNNIYGQYGNVPYRGWTIPWSTIFTNNFKWDYIADPSSPNRISGCIPLGMPLDKYNYKTFINTSKHTVLEESDLCIGASLALWTETIDQGNIDYKLVLNCFAFSESVWRYTPHRLPDNIQHAEMRLLYQKQKIKLLPYNKKSSTLIYDEMSQLKHFPMGYEMSKYRFNKNYKHFFKDDGSIEPDFFKEKNVIGKWQYTFNPTYPMFDAKKFNKFLNDSINKETKKTILKSADFPKHIICNNLLTDINKHTNKLSVNMFVLFNQIGSSSVLTPFQGNAPNPVDGQWNLQLNSNPFLMADFHYLLQGYNVEDALKLYKHNIRSNSKKEASDNNQKENIPKMLTCSDYSFKSPQFKHHPYYTDCRTNVFKTQEIKLGDVTGKEAGISFVNSYKTNNQTES